MHIWKDKHFRKKIKVPRIPKKTIADFKMDSRFNIDEMDRSNNKLDFPELPSQ